MEKESKKQRSVKLEISIAEATELINMKVEDEIARVETELGESIKNDREELTKEIKKRNKYSFWSLIGVLLVVISIFGLSIPQAIKTGKLEIQEQIMNRIDKEFETPRIQALIDSAAIEFIENKADTFYQERVEQTIGSFRIEMDTVLEKGRLKTQKLSELFDIYIIADEAEAGSKNAYLDLSRYETDTTINGKIAYLKLVSIIRELRIYKQIPTAYQQLYFVEFDNEISFDVLSLDEIVERMENPTMSHETRSYCMPYIKRKTNKEIFEKSIDVLENSDSLPTCAAFCGVLYEISEKRTDFLDFDGWTIICEENLKETE